MYEIFIKTHFSAAHHLRYYVGKCANQHGHTWLVEVRCACRELNHVGMGIDFVDLKRATNEILDSLDHCDLNELPHFQHVNPTTENIARFVFDLLSARLNTERVRVSRVTIGESATSGVVYTPPQNDSD